MVNKCLPSQTKCSKNLVAIFFRYSCEKFWEFFQVELTQEAKNVRIMPSGRKLGEDAEASIFKLKLVKYR